VARDVVVVQPVVHDQLVHQAQRQRAVGAGQQGDVLVALVGGFGAARVDADQLGAVALGLLRQVQKCRLLAIELLPQIRISLASAKNSRCMPTLPP
jgi:hypothetical protein